MFLLVWLTFKILILLVIQKVQLWKVIFSHSRMPTFLWLYLHFFTGQFHLMSLKVAGDFATERFPPLGPSSWLIWQVWVNILASQSISNIYQHHHSQAHVCQLIILICHMLFWRRILKILVETYCAPQNNCCFHTTCLKLHFPSWASYSTSMGVNKWTCLVQQIVNSGLTTWAERAVCSTRGAVSYILFYWCDLVTALKSEMGTRVAWLDSSHI